MNNVLSKLGFQVRTVEDIAERCGDIANGLNVSSDSVYKNAMSYLPNDLTNMFITAFFDAVKDMIEEKRDELGLSDEELYVEKDVNDAASRISAVVCKDGKYEWIILNDEDDIQAAFSEAVWQHYLADENVKTVIDECKALMKEAGCDAEALEEYAKIAVENDFRYDEYSAEDVINAYQGEAIAWVQEQLESKGLQDKVDFVSDGKNIYLNGEPYNSREKTLTFFLNTDKQYHEDFKDRLPF